jgi:hypothetical protein
MSESWNKNPSEKHDPTPPRGPEEKGHIVCEWCGRIDCPESDEFGCENEPQPDVQTMTPEAHKRLLSEKSAKGAGLGEFLPEPEYCGVSFFREDIGCRSVCGRIRGHKGEHSWFRDPTPSSDGGEK